MKVDRNRPDPPGMAFFISPHGFGHAARAAAVMEAVGTNIPGCRFDIFTTVPSWFFEDSLSVPFTYHSLESDIGLVQRDAFNEDIDRTLERLNAFLPFDPFLIAELDATVSGSGCGLILCDIAPLGIAVARSCGLPAVLIENFTWDAIYGGYPALAGTMAQHIQYLKRIFTAADHCIQTEPVCFRRTADLTVGPVSRRFKTDRETARRQLGLAKASRMVLITTGGIPTHHGFFDELKKWPDICFVVPGVAPAAQWVDNLFLLPHRSDFFHPDLTVASDAVVGKAGYSTIAEVYAAGTPFGFAARPDYPETPGLVDFIRKEMSAIALSEAEFSSGGWLACLSRLLALPRRPPRNPDGAQRAAAYIGGLLSHRAEDSLFKNEVESREDSGDQ